MSELPKVLQVEEVEPGRWVGPNPETDPEGRDVIFSGQILAQMVMAATAAVGGDKEVKSIHAVFARPGHYSAGPLELRLDPMHAGRAWASNTATAYQGNQLLSRGLILLNAVEPDLMRHSPTMPDVPGPDECGQQSYGVVFPGADVRLVDNAAAVTPDGSPVISFWFRNPESYDSVAANQAIVAWTQPGFIIGAAIRPHSDVVDYSQTHRSISTGVISHTSHFHEHGDVGDWLLISHAASYAGHGRVFGTGGVFTRDGTLVSTFSQDSMARRVERQLDFKTGM